jgi:hypothetical protein
MGMKKFLSCADIGAHQASPTTQENPMGKGLLLWLVGIPIPIILLLWVFGYLH